MHACVARMCIYHPSACTHQTPISARLSDISLRSMQLDSCVMHARPVSRSVLKTRRRRRHSWTNAPIIRYTQNTHTHTHTRARARARACMHEHSRRLGISILTYPSRANFIYARVLASSRAWRFSASPRIRLCARARALANVTENNISARAQRVI